MPRERWDHLRQRINLRRRDDPENPLARCRLCEAGVFIKVQLRDGRHAPFYAHFSEGGAKCPWRDSSLLRPDDARAAQYNGQQESAFHRYLCEKIGELAQKDARCIQMSVELYRRPHVHLRGRWPDVHLDMGNLGRFALEIQLSKPFAIEIAARHLHYDREGVSLLWIFSRLDEPPPQGFRDVITMQRGNAFVFDEETFRTSVERGTLILKCYMEDSRSGYLKPRLVTLEDLNTRSGPGVFFEDRRTARLLQACKSAREPWWKAILAAQSDRFPFVIDNPEFSRAWSSLRPKVPEISEWKEEYWKINREKGRMHFARLFAIIYSIVSSSGRGEEIIYITNYKNEGKLLAMINSQLGSQEFSPYANLIEEFIRNTGKSDLARRDSFQKTAQIARSRCEQVDGAHPVWKAVRRLFPEVLDAVVRAELNDLGQLPAWAKPSA